jgi:hypothetical protein
MARTRTLINALPEPPDFAAIKPWFVASPRMEAMFGIADALILGLQPLDLIGLNDNMALLLDPLPRKFLRVDWRPNHIIRRFGVI